MVSSGSELKQNRNQQSLLKNGETKISLELEKHFEILNQIEIEKRTAFIFNLAQKFSF